MRRVMLVACVLLCAGTLFAVVPGAQTPPAQAPGTPPPPQQRPVFRSEVDFVRLDVSVLDRNRRPVRGLTQKDFRVYEDGKLQELVALTEIDIASIDPPPSAWMRFTPRDVEANNLQDQAGDGRVIAIVIDDCNQAMYWLGIVTVIREIGHLIVDRLGTSDVGAVVYVTNRGKTQEFTEDRGKLHDAIDRFERAALGTIVPGGRFGGPPTQIVPAHDGCGIPTSLVSTLDTVTSRLVTIPNRRKTVLVITPGVALSASSAGQAARIHGFDPMDPWRTVFWKAQRGNVNIYPIDPSDQRRYGNELQTPGANASSRTASPRTPMVTSVNLRRELLKTAADETGGRAIVSTRDLERELDEVFDEAGSYYLLGYRTSNDKQDGRFRKAEVKVTLPGAIVRARSGYYAQKEGRLTTPAESSMPSSRDFVRAGLMSPAALPLRAAVFPLGPKAGTRGIVDVAVTLTTRLPPIQTPMAERLNIVRTLYDTEGRPGTPAPETADIQLQPQGGDQVRYDVYQRLALAPGRYSIRFNATSAALDKSGSVYVDFDVPDFTREPLSVSPIVIGTRAPGSRDDVLAPVLPIVPTTVRSFAAGERPIAFVRVAQGGSAPLLPATATVKILDLADATVSHSTHAIAVDAFDGSRSAPFESPLTLAGLASGPYLLTVEVTTSGGVSARRDLVFRIR